VDNILKLKESDKGEVQLNEEKKNDINNIELNQLKYKSNSSSSTNIKNGNEVKLDADE